MNRLAALWKKDPGLVVSGGAHLLALVFLVADFSRAPTFDDTQEAVSVEMVTTSELNQVMKGEETAKPLPTPQRRVDKVASIEESNPAPPLAEARKDTPPPPAPDKPNDDPGPDARPVEAALPPPPVPAPRPVDPTPAAPSIPMPPVPMPPVPMPPVQPPAPPVAALPPTPPERPVEAPTPPPRPDPVKPLPPPEAEAIEPTPPPRPKIDPPKTEAKQEAKPQPKKVAKPVPVPHPREVKEAKVVPPPPPKPEPIKAPPPKPDPSALDRVARLLDTLKPDILKPKPLESKSPEPRPPEPPAKPRSGNESKEPPRDSFDPSKISALLDHDAPQHKASTGRALTQVASLGAPTGHAEKMSPSMMAQLDGWMIDHYRGCWSYFGLGATQDYVPEVRVRLAQDGSLIGQPALLNPPRDPNLKSLADSAIRAVNRCNPMAMPDRFKPFYQSWRDRTVRFDPKEMS